MMYPHVNTSRISIYTRVSVTLKKAKARVRAPKMSLGLLARSKAMSFAVLLYVYGGFKFQNVCMIYVWESFSQKKFFHGEKVKQQIWVKANEVNWTSLSLFSCETIFEAGLRFSWPSICFLIFFLQKMENAIQENIKIFMYVRKKALRTTRLKFTVSCLAAQHLEFLKNFHVE